jgi:cell division septal protein FtsQ
LGPAEARPKAAAAGYVVAANGIQRRDWVILLENGNVVYAGRPSPSRRLPSTPVLPLQLVLLEAGTYLLTVDATGAAGFTLLD